jgi:hypothetical protein
MDPEKWGTPQGWKLEQRITDFDRKLEELEDKVDSLWLAFKITEDRKARRGRFIRAVLQSLALVGGLGGALVALLNYFFPHAPAG